MASKVPKFGAWEGGENYTVYFENARKVKSNGQMINPNDPQDNPDMFPQNGTPIQTPSTPSRAESQGQQAKLPQFGAWDNGDNVGYTVYFENARKNKTVEPTKAESQAQAQARPATIKPETQEARSKMPQFGAWNEGENVAYTAYFDNARKNKNDGLGATPVEPQLNPDAADRGRPPCAATKTRSQEQLAEGGFSARPEQRSTKEEGPVRSTSPPSVNGSETPFRHGRQTPGGQTPQHPRGGKTQLKPVGRGSQNCDKGAAIPQFGVWNTDPSQAEDFTGAFMRAKMTPLNNDTRASQQHQTHQSNKPKKGCCFPCFG